MTRILIPFLMSTSTKSPSPPPSPRTSSFRLSLYSIAQARIGIQRIRKSKEIVSSSGPEPITHSALSGVVYPRKLAVSRSDEFICTSGVDIPQLLRACRVSLLEQARRDLGANVLVDEQYITIRYSPPILTNLNLLQMENLHCPPKKTNRWPVQSSG